MKNMVNALVTEAPTSNSHKGTNWINSIWKHGLSGEEGVKLISKSTKGFPNGVENARAVQVRQAGEPGVEGENIFREHGSIRGKYCRGVGRMIWDRWDGACFLSGAWA